MLKLTKRPESDFWQITGMCPFTRQRIRTSTATPNKDQAEAVLTRYLEDQKRTALLGPKQTTLFVDAVEEYIGKNGETRFLDPLLAEFGERPMLDLTDQDLTAGAARHYPSVKPSTLVRQWYVPFQAVWNAAARAKMVPERTFQKPKFRTPPSKYATDEWLDDCLHACTTLEQRAALLFMSFSAARVSEMIAVRVKHHDPVAMTVLLVDTKNGDARLVPLPAFVNAVLNLLPHTDPQVRMFGYSHRDSFTKVLQRACRRAAIEYLSPHKAGRHAFAARYLRDGNSIRSMMEAGGWRSIGAAMRYAHLERSKVEASVRNVSTTIGTNLTHLISLPGN